VSFNHFHSSQGAARIMKGCYGNSHQDTKKPCEYWQIILYLLIKQRFT